MSKKRLKRSMSKSFTKKLNRSKMESKEQSRNSRNALFLLDSDMKVHMSLTNWFVDKPRIMKRNEIDDPPRVSYTQ